MKKFFLTTVSATAMFFIVGSITAQETEKTETETTTEQIQQKETYNRIEPQELPDAVHQAVDRDYKGATIVHIYSVVNEEGETKYKIVLATKDGQAQELYADAEGNWIQKDDDLKTEEKHTATEAS